MEAQIEDSSLEVMKVGYNRFMVCLLKGNNFTCPSRFVRSAAGESGCVLLMHVSVCALYAFS